MSAQEVIAKYLIVTAFCLLSVLKKCQHKQRQVHQVELSQTK